MKLCETEKLILNSLYLKMRISNAAAFLLFVLLCSFSGENPVYNPFAKLQYDTVIAYDYEPMDETPFVLKNGKFTGNILKQKPLSAKQISFITQTICDTSTYGNSTAACFEPHFALVFFKKDSVLANVEICLECNFLQSTETIPAQTFYNIKIPEDSLELPRYGFSKTGRKQINKLVKELGFSHTIKPGSMFDE